MKGKIAFVILSSLIVIGMVLIFALAIPMVINLALIFALKAENEELLSIATLSGLIGIAGALFSLYPSYKLSQKLAKIIEKKWGVKIEKQKKLFWLSVLLPITLLILVGLVT